MKFAIAKFGGTSMADVEIIKKSAEVLKSRSEIRMCVISATAGSTNQLFSMARAAAAGSSQESSEGFSQFRERHLHMIKALATSGAAITQVEGYCARVEEILQGMKLLKEASLSALDDLVSHGELISSVLFAEALKGLKLQVLWLDARHLMKTSSDHGRAIPQLDVLKLHAENEVKPRLEKMIVVTQGYIGSDSHGRTTTLGKEGSDYSTALFAEALEASEVQIWKDVPGVMTTDPRLVKAARTLPEISFSEVSELTRFGAKVIHPDTFLPTVRAGIPVYVGYSQDTQVKGTCVVVTPEQSPAVRAVALKREQKWLTVKEPEGINAPLFLLHVLQVLNTFKVTPTIVSTSENRVGFVIDKVYALTSDLIRELKSLGATEVLEAEMLAVIGSGLRSRADIQSKILSCVKSAPLLVSSGASDFSFCVVTPPGRSEESLEALHKHLLEQP